MAERRMFAKTIVLSDAFLDMPLTARCLYFTLGMLADDDGFVNSPKSITRQCGASEDDLRILISKKFVIAFENGVIVIKHWRLNNYLRSDRYKPTVYADEKRRITADEAGIYHVDASVGIPDIGIPSNGIPRLGKDRIGKDSIGEDRVGKERGTGETRTSSRKQKKSNVDLFMELEEGRLSSVYETVLEWMQYKDERAQHNSKEHYVKTGMKNVIAQIENNVRKYGAAAVIDCINLSMSNNWQGIIWDKINEHGPSQRRNIDHDIDEYIRSLQEEEARNAEIRGGKGAEVP